MIKVGLVSLGCPKNLVDSEAILGYLKKENFQICLKDFDSVDALVVNTCCFIDEAKKESVDAILEAADLRKNNRIKALIVAGCMSQRYKGNLVKELPEVDGFLGTGDIARVGEVVRNAVSGKRALEVGSPEFVYHEHTPRVRLTPDHYAYVKVAEGCEHGCTYCVIPKVRGRYRSRKIESIVAEIESLAEKGVKEINLISQDTTSYGQDIYGRQSLCDLFGLLAKSKVAPSWIRLLYTHPAGYTDDFIEAIREYPWICKYVDLPAQHVNDNILRAMGRKMKKQDILRLIEKLRERIPDLAIRTSLIVGFPGESEKQFKELLNFVNDVKFERLGVFTFSPQEGTRAARFAGQTEQKVKEERRDIIMSAQREISTQINRSFIGKEVWVLIDEKNEESYVGRTQWDAPDIDGQVWVKSTGIRIGELVKVKVVDAYEYDLVAKKEQTCFSIVHSD
jgi:ribosomal protein S12 methylthiotransferase